MTSIPIKVDFERCDANGTCAALMPHIFSIGEDGRLTQLRDEVQDTESELLEEVILCCPMEAISRS
jgi:ferredoxin